MNDIIRAILSMSDEEFERVMQRAYFESRCELRAKKWFGWTHPFFDWTPEERKLYYREHKRQKRLQKAGGKTR